MHTKFHLHAVLTLANILRTEEVNLIVGQTVYVVTMKNDAIHYEYQLSSPCMLPSESLRSVEVILVINPRCGLQYLVCLSVRLSVSPSVTTISATTRNKQVKKRHQRVQRCTGFILRMAIFVKVPHSEVMA